MVTVLSRNASARMSVFYFKKNGPFLLQNVFISDFWLEFEISASKLTPVPNFSSIEQNIRELEFRPGKLDDVIVTFW